MINRSLSILLLFIFVHIKSYGQQSEEKRTFSVEMNPLAFAFGGWSFGGSYKPAELNHWLFSAATYGFKMPDVFVDQIPGNENKGFNLKIKSAVAIGADYFPWTTNRSGFAVGASAILTDFEVTHKDEAGKANYTGIYVVPRVSYSWFAFKGLYISPSLGVEFHKKLSGNTMVGSQEFTPMSVQFSPNISIGYAF